MTRLASGRSIATALVVLGVAVVAVTLAIPPEVKLGSAIRIVLLHGALARTGMVLFTGGAIVGLMGLLKPGPRVDRLNRVVQRVAVGAWIVYAISAVIATWLTWGVPVAWGEPRTQASAKILLMAVGFVGVSRWTNQARFTAIANVFAGVVANLLVRTAGLVQHPESPVMTADTTIYPFLFIALWILLVAMALLVVRWDYRRILPGP